MNVSVVQRSESGNIGVGSLGLAMSLLLPVPSKCTVTCNESFMPFPYEHTSDQSAFNFRM